MNFLCMYVGLEEMSRRQKQNKDIRGKIKEELLIRETEAFGCNVFKA